MFKIRIVAAMVVLLQVIGFSHARATTMRGTIDQIALSGGILTFSLNGSKVGSAACDKTLGYAVQLSTTVGKNASIDFFEAKRNGMKVFAIGLGTCSIHKGFEDLKDFGVAATFSDSPVETTQMISKVVNTAVTTTICMNGVYNPNSQTCSSPPACKCGTGTHVISNVTSFCSVAAANGGSQCTASTCEVGSGNHAYGACCICAP